MSAYDTITDALRAAGLKVTENSAGARSQCPSHQSRSLTLSIRHPKMDSDPVRLTCFASCDAVDVLGAIGLRLRDLYDGNARPAAHPRTRRKPTPFDALGDPDHFASRCLQQEQLEADPEYQPHRVHLTAWPTPRADYTGGPSGDWGL